MDWNIYLTPLLQGAWVTVQLTVYSTILGAITAFVFGIGKLSSNWFYRGFSICFVEIFRGTSLLVQLFWLFFALPLLGQALGLDFRMAPLVAGTLALGFNIGAYGAEVVRGACRQCHVRNLRRPSAGLYAAPDITVYLPAAGHSGNDAQLW
ncbi:ABC transporter permease subunit [Advenella kashmirensis]|uniref:ABC transporter permease subunit n=1 Tax=Advenella kashmirensis TaxID=310575 RepID=UPI001EE67957|nr:ABC transporter permease subunit [Advenella kashmirensis]